MRVKSIVAAVIGCVLVGNISSFGNTLTRKSPNLLAVEKTTGESVEIDKLPTVVVEAVKKELPGARLTKAMKLPDGSYLLTDVKVGKKEYNVTVAADGKILKREEDND